MVPWWSVPAALICGACVGILIVALMAANGGDD